MEKHLQKTMEKDIEAGASRGRVGVIPVRFQARRQG